MDEKLWREATINDANPQQMWVVPVERCEHGNTERHIVESSIHLTSNATYTLKWCEGADLGGGV